MHGDATLCSVNEKGYGLTLALVLRHFELCCCQHYYLLATSIGTGT